MGSSRNGRRVVMSVDNEDMYFSREVKTSTRNGGKKKPKPKPQFEEERNPPPVNAKTEKQREYFRMLDDPEIQVIVALGLHGTGKTFCPSVTAADQFRRNEISSIVVARAYVQTGKTSGYKPGTSFEKLYPYVRNVLDTIKSRIGDGAYDIALKNGEIQVQEVESIRGRSFDEKGWLIIDEAQQTTPDEMLSIVTRVSDNCKMVLCGDLRQCDISGQSGLEWFMKFAQRHNLKGVGVIDFCDPEDIVRGGLVRDIAVGIMKDQGSK